MDKTCLICRKRFHIKPSHASKKFYCSKECMSVAYRERHRGEENPNWKGGLVVKPCAYCGKKYNSYPCNAKFSKFCSSVCMGAAKQKHFCPFCGIAAPANRKYCTNCWKQHRPKLTKSCAKCQNLIPGNRAYCQNCSPRGKGKTISICEQCGRSFEHWKCAKRKFCSSACIRSIQKGEGNPNWKGGRLTIAQLLRNSKKNRELIKAVLKRDKFTCKLCGQVGGMLEVDHIKPFGIILTEFL